MTLEPRRPKVFGLRIDPDRLLPAERYPFGTGGGERLVELARALASSPVWEKDDDAVLVVRTEPPAGLAVIGYLSEETEARLETLPAQLETLLPRFRYVSYARAEEDCELLAERLVERFGVRDLRRMSYAPIPRGGLIVLGILSYVLGLERSRLAEGSGDGGPLVVVDDCSITGLRFGEFLRTHPDRDVVFAHLYSHPDLRASIRSREPRVVAAASARDLYDFAPEQMGAAYAGWQDRWSDRTEGRCYWLGRPEHLCFPWTEPDFTVWNPRAETEEPGWRVAPPAACLRNRIQAGEGRIEVQVQPASAGSVRLSEGTFHGALNGDEFLANLESGAVVRLGGTAGDVWRTIVRHGGPDGAAEELARSYEAEASELRNDASKLLDDLRARGFLLTGGAHAGARLVR